ncbi:MAG: methyltransferase domain-containing protein [Myxococcota bacterium]
MADDFLPVDFADPWEHVRLLSDRVRNDALLQLLTRRAPGARVLEVGCGTGLLSCVAARLGARRVIAVEQTALAERARQLVADNGLQDVVSVVEARIEDVAPEPVDLAFSELLNADPFNEGVVSAMQAAARWVAPGGWLSPRRLKVHVALAYAEEPAVEYAAASREVARICEAHGLRAGVLQDTLAVEHPQRIVTSLERPVSEVATPFELTIGPELALPAPVVVRVRAKVTGTVAGAIVWFAAEVDEGCGCRTRRGGSHWGQLVCGWRRGRRVRVGEQVALRVRLVGDQLLVDVVAE